MTKREMIKVYNSNSKADKYIIGFIYKHSTYIVTLDRIPQRLMFRYKEASRLGGKYSLSVKIKNADKELWINKYNAVCIGDEHVLDGEYNKGVELERYLYNQNGIKFKGKDGVPFNIDVDITINNIKYQVKFINNLCRMTYESYLQKLALV